MNTGTNFKDTVERRIAPLSAASSTCLRKIVNGKEFVLKMIIRVMKWRRPTFRVKSAGFVSHDTPERNLEEILGAGY